jgi:hypothetical protein
VRKNKRGDHNDIINQRDTRNLQQAEKPFRPRTPPPSENVTHKSTPKKSPEKQQILQHQQQQHREQNVGREPITPIAHKGPCTPPPLLIDEANEATRGPQTPSEPHENLLKNPPASLEKSFETPVKIAQFFLTRICN